VEEPHEDLRKTSTPPDNGDASDSTGKDDDEGLTALEQPEPLVVAPDVLRQQYREEFERMVEDQATRVYIHIAEFVKVRSFKEVFRFMRLHMRIYAEAKVSPGFAGGGIRGRWWAKTFWSYTFWETRHDMERFTKRGGHGEMLEQIRELAAPGSCYVEWDAAGGLDWTGAMARLEHPTRYYVDPYFG
jgi:hypothetical protein